jgi:hypothetical protein
LIAGTAAVVGAGAIAVNPVVGVQLSLPSINVPAAAQVALAAFDSPLAQLFATLDVANNYLLDSASFPANANNWPYAGFGEYWGVPPTNYPVLPFALIDPALGGYSSVGVIPQFIDDALPIISQLGYNGSDYLNVTGDALFGAGYALSEGVWNAIGDLLTLNIQGAVETFANSISVAGTLLLGAGGYVLQNVVAKAQAVFNTLASGVGTILGVTAAQISLVVAKTVQVVQDTFAATTFEGGWNAAIDGLFGPSGIPGTILNLTIGAGVQTGPIVPSDPFDPDTYPAAIEGNFVPSVRTEVQALVKAITADLQVVGSPAAAAPAGARKAARAAAAAAAPAAVAPAAEAGAAEAGAAEAGADAGSAAVAVSVEKPAKKQGNHRTVRAAAKAAAHAG